MSYNVIIYCVAGIAKRKIYRANQSRRSGVKNVPTTVFTFKFDRGFNVIV